MTQHEIDRQRPQHDLKVSVIVIENDAKEKRVQVTICNASEQMATNVLMKADAADRLGRALQDAGRIAASGLVIAQAAGPMGRA